MLNLHSTCDAAHHQQTCPVAFSCLAADVLTKPEKHNSKIVQCASRQWFDCLCRYQTKFGKLWDAADKSVRSAGVPQAGSEVLLNTVPSGPLEQAMSTHAPGLPAQTHSIDSSETESESEDGPPQSAVRQGSMFDIFGRTMRSVGSILPSRKSSVAFPQPEDDLSGSSYMYRDY